MLSKASIKHVDDRTKLIVQGFNNRARKLFPQNITYYNIPSIANHICLLFYWQRDHFNTFNKEEVKLSDDKMEANVRNSAGNRWNTIYGHLTFDNKLYPNTTIEYELITYLKGHNFGAIGIVSAEEEHEQQTNALIWGSSSKHKQAYSFHCSQSSNMYCIGNGKLTSTEYHGDKQWRYHSDGDIIKMMVDIPNESVTFWSITKGEKIGGYCNIDFSMKHRFAISMISGNSVRLLSVKFAS